jgi:hypothetical protein
MAVVLNKIANDEIVCARQRPSGLTGIPADRVALVCRATSRTRPGPTHSRALPAKIPVSQRSQGLNQRFPKRYRAKTSLAIPLIGPFNKSCRDATES